MIERLQELLLEAGELQSEALKRQVCIALSRIILQHACLSLVEWISIKQVYSNKLTISVGDIEKLKKPADGTLAEVLGVLLVSAQNEGWPGVCRPFWKKIETNRPACRLTKDKNPNLEQIMNGFIRLRNDSVEGHGLPGNYDCDAELDFIYFLIDSLREVLPRFNETKSKFYIIDPEENRIELQFIQPKNGNLICYRKIKISSGRAVIDAQEQVDLFSKSDFTYSTVDIFSLINKSTFPGYEIYESGVDLWKPLIILPEKLSSHFTGRVDQIKELSEWFNDQDSRVCMVYGDGGIGKTTLVIECIHRLLQGEIESDWRPELITFFTAKRNAWG
jgi:hypothetical protein